MADDDVYSYKELEYDFSFNPVQSPINWEMIEEANKSLLIINSDPFANRLVKEGKIVEPWPHVMHTSGGFCRLILPIIGLERKILTALLEGQCPKSEDEEFSYLKGYDIKKYFELRMDPPKLLHEVTRKTFEDFLNNFTNATCTDWAKITPDGESYGGPWKAPDGSEERDNAYSLCLKDNAKALWETGYPPLALLYCAEFLCAYMCHGVAEVRDLCKWVSDFPKEEEE